jgi:hypothetical protein
MLVNGIKRGEGERDDNIRSIYDKMGGYHKAFDEVSAAINEGRLELETGRAYQNSLNQLYPDQVGKPDPSKQEAMAAATGGGANPWSYFGMSGPPDLSQMGRG